jgi:hypothetical protein
LANTGQSYDQADTRTLRSPTSTWGFVVTGVGIGHPLPGPDIPASNSSRSHIGCSELTNFQWLFFCRREVGHGMRRW